jgi:hypothetical protein
MKALKTSLQELREVFEKSITVRDIAEPIISFDSSQQASDVRELLERRDFDVVGVRKAGNMIGFAKKTDLVEGVLADHATNFDGRNQLSDRTSLLDVFKILSECQQVFVVFKDQVWGIITRGDLQKAPVRMWLFGLISLLEMNFLRLIRLKHPNDTWHVLIGERRLAKAQKLLDERKRRNEAVDLADCLEFCDKRAIVVKTDSVRTRLGFLSIQKGTEQLVELEALRNNLAHAQDIITGNWPKVVKLAALAEELLIKCEEAPMPGEAKTGSGVGPR